MRKYDFNKMTAEQKEICATAMLCRRILQIDPTENDELGCPAEFVAFPMLRHFIKERRGWTPELQPHDYVMRMMYADGQGRGCEIGEIQFFAQKYLDEIFTESAKSFPPYIPAPIPDRHFLTDEMKAATLARQAERNE